MLTPESRIKAVSGRFEVISEYADVRKKAPYGFVKSPKPKVVATPKRVLPQSDMEELARLREMSAAKIESQRFPDQDNFKDTERQLGSPMHSSNLISKVKKINPRLICEDSINCKGHAGFYYFSQTGEKKATGASFKKGILSEFSVIETDAADLPVRVQYGWREVLLRLVKAKQLSLKQVLRVFGDTATVQSTNWRRDAQQFRT